MCVCIDIDECARDADDCDGESSNCTNSDGSYGCSCRSGYNKVRKRMVLFVRIV